MTKPETRPFPHGQGQVDLFHLLRLQELQDRLEFSDRRGSFGNPVREVCSSLTASFGLFASLSPRRRR